MTAAMPPPPQDPGRRDAQRAVIGAPAIRGFPREEATFAFMAGLFMVVLVLTNVIGTKLFSLGDLTLTSGIITYPITFLLTDVVSEIWGRKRANFMVISGFGMSLVMLAILQLAIHLEPAPIWTLPRFGFEEADGMQNAFHATFSNPGILLFGSMTAYLVAQLFDVRLYHLLWRLTGGRHMWLRNNGSTWVSQLVDTIIVNSIFLRFGLHMEWGPIWGIIGANYLIKITIAVLDTPLIYVARIWLEKFLGIEHDAARSGAPLA